MAFSTADHDLILRQLARCYGLTPDQLQCLTDNPADGVYGFTRHGQAFVIKYSNTTVRSFATLQSQVHWLDFLATQGAAVSRPVPSPRGMLVEQVPLRSALVSTVCYARALGVRPPVPRSTAEQWQRWGETLGKLHALSARYTPPLNQAPLAQWDVNVTQDRATIPAEQTSVLAKFDALQAYLQTLPTDPQLYGMIHGDFQANNLCLDRETFWVIDFDNCTRHWFLTDIATSLYFALWERPGDQSNATFAGFVLEHLWAGYAREFSLDVAWLERLPVFLKVIEMNNYRHPCLQSDDVTAQPGSCAAKAARFAHALS